MYRSPLLFLRHLKHVLIAAITSVEKYQAADTGLASVPCYQLCLFTDPAVPPRPHPLHIGEISSDAESVTTAHTEAYEIAHRSRC